MPPGRAAGQRAGEASAGLAALRVVAAVLPEGGGQAWRADRWPPCGRAGGVRDNAAPDSQHSVAAPHQRQARRERAAGRACARRASSRPPSPALPSLFSLFRGE
eukprot:scaffold125358_cov30-Tisochrysis_lutea.AAC.3